MDEALRKQPWWGAVSLPPSHAPWGSAVGPSVGHSRLCDEDLFPAWAMGWASSPWQLPWQLDSRSLFPLPEAQWSLASAWQERELSLLCLLPKPETSVMPVP